MPYMVDYIYVDDMHVLCKGAKKLFLHAQPYNINLYNMQNYNIFQPRPVELCKLLLCITFCLFVDLWPATIPDSRKWRKLSRKKQNIQTNQKIQNIQKIKNIQKTPEYA